MRIDVKTVRSKKYLQFVNKQGDIFHVGPASDFDSWLISAIMWDRHWKIEYHERRRDFFDLLEIEMNKNVQLDETKMQSFDALRLQDIRLAEEVGRPLRVPKVHLFGSLERNENIKQRRWRPWKWCLNEWGMQVQKRLNEINSKQSKLERKYEKFHLPTEKEEQLRAIKELRTKAYEIVLAKQKKILSVLIEIEAEKGFARKDEVIKESAVKHKIPNEETEEIINILLREGVLYEPGEGHLKKT
jgi:hypothetical protein